MPTCVRSQLHRQVENPLLFLLVTWCWLQQGHSCQVACQAPLHNNSVVECLTNSLTAVPFVEGWGRGNQTEGAGGGG